MRSMLPLAPWLIANALAAPAEPTPELYASTHIAVDLAEGVALDSDGLPSDATLRAQLQQLGITRLERIFRDVPNRRDPELFRQLGMHRAYRAILDGRRARPEQALAAVATLPAITYAELDAKQVAHRTPNDKYFVYQWGLLNKGNFTADAVEGADSGAWWAWEFTTGEGVTVAVLDTGINMEEPDIVEQIWVNEGEIPDNDIDDDNNGYVDDVRGWSFPYNNNDSGDIDGHGTNVAGIVGATGNNALGLSGVCWNCSIMNVKVLNSFGTGDSTVTAEGITYAADNGAQVINLSLGSPSYNLNSERAIDYAWGVGSTPVASMGNDSVERKNYPAAYNRAIAVGASDPADARAEFSNYGEWNEIMAPGTTIYSISRSNGDYEQYMSGTSQASPHVSGVIALMLTIDPTLEPAEIRDILHATAADEVGPSDEDTPGHDKYFGHGRVDAYAALRMIDPTLGDADGDGVGIREDCDDDDPSIYPGAEESCDEVDSDCNGSLADAFDDIDGDDLPDCVDDTNDNEEEDEGGCSTLPASSMLLGVLVLPLLRRRR